MLMAGIENLPLGAMNEPSMGTASSSGSVEPMTMKVVGISQTVPYPGKLGLRRRAAEREVDAARASADASRLAVASHE
jgi:hypothetical protein